MLIPEIYQTYLNNDKHNNLHSYKEFLEEYSLSKHGVSNSSTLQWLHTLGFKYNTKEEKSYFSDKHERDENIIYCIMFFDKFFELELERLNCWSMSKGGVRSGLVFWKKAAIEIYGSTKKEIKEPLTLIRFFDLGINGEGYWNYFHMALQIEDTFDVLSVKFLS